MTLLITGICTTFAALVSDRRLSRSGAVVDDETSKTGVLECRDATLLYAYTGLAQAGSFMTRRWILDSFLEAGQPDYTAERIFSKLQETATKFFQTDLRLLRLGTENKRLTIVFAGYLADGRFGFGELSNFELNGRVRPIASDEFKLNFRISKIRDEASSAVMVHGNYAGLIPDGLAALNKILVRRAPPQAFTEKAAALIRKAAEQPNSAGTIGRQLMISQLLPGSDLTPARPIVESFYSTEKLRDVTYAPDRALVTGGSMLLLSDFSLRSTGVPVAVPRVHRNAPCPCGSHLRYRQCHGRK